MRLHDRIMGQLPDDITRESGRRAMKRPTLEAKLQTELGLTVFEFANAVKINRSTLSKWFLEKPLTIKLLVSGYKKEVLNSD